MLYLISLYYSPQTPPGGKGSTCIGLCVYVLWRTVIKSGLALFCIHVGGREGSFAEEEFSSRQARPTANVLHRQSPRLLQ